MVGPPNGPPGQSSDSLREFGLVKGSKLGKGMSLESKPPYLRYFIRMAISASDSTDVE